jgi:hypothetical protein
MLGWSSFLPSFSTFGVKSSSMFYLGRCCTWTASRGLSSIDGRIICLWLLSPRWSFWKPTRSDKILSATCFEIVLDPETATLVDLVDFNRFLNRKVMYVLWSMPTVQDEEFVLPQLVQDLIHAEPPASSWITLKHNADVPTIFSEGSSSRRWFDCMFGRQAWSAEKLRATIVRPSGEIRRRCNCFPAGPAAS